MNKVGFYILFIGMTCLAFNAGATNVDKSLMVSEDVTVIVENLRGKVVIVGQETSHVRVEGQIDKQAKSFVFKQEQDTVFIQVKMPEHVSDSFWGNKKQHSNLTITMPMHGEIVFKGVSSDIQVKSVNGDLDIHTISGNVVVERSTDGANSLRNKVSIETVSGEIKTTALSGQLALTTVSGSIDDTASKGQIKYQTVSGDIKGESAAGSVKANAISANVELTLHAVSELKLSTVSGDVECDLGVADNGIIKASSVSGDLIFALPEGVNLDIKAQSNAGGNIKNKLNQDKVIVDKYGPGSQLRTTLGNGSAQLKATTMSGKVLFKN